MVLSKVFLILGLFILCIMFVPHTEARRSITFNQDNMWRGYYIPAGGKYFVCSTDNAEYIPCYEIFLKDKRTCSIKQSKLYCQSPISAIGVVNE